MIFRILAIFAVAVTLFYAACTNSDDFLYDEDDSIFIDISAEMAFSFDSMSQRSKADTISPNDTLIFIANIYPSKSIKIRRYLWTLDGIPLSYDFSFRSTIDFIIARIKEAIDAPKCGCTELLLHLSESNKFTSIFIPLIFRRASSHTGIVMPHLKYIIFLIICIHSTIAI